MTPLDIADPIQAAAAARLRYVTDAMPGIQRRREAEDFRYFLPNGERLTDRDELARIRALGIPPAWTDVWIAPLPHAHLQATGRDARGRKQYRYHARWRAVRDENKFGRMAAFGAVLPLIRQRALRDLSQPGLTREKVLAVVVLLLDITHLRVGNEEYARENGTFGLTTMRGEHVDIAGATIRFRFRGKAGKMHRIRLHDRRLAVVLKRCQELPGQELFQYLDDEGQLHPIDSQDVNDYLRTITGQDFTAKDFRTWAGTLVACCALKQAGSFDSETQAKRNVVQAIKAAAEHLGNTPAISRKSYVHPAVLAAYLAGACFPGEPEVAQQAIEPGEMLIQEESEVLALLRRLVPEVDQGQGAA